MLLTKQQILSADDLPFRDVDVPEWGGSVRVRTMTGMERDEFEGSILKARKDGTVDTDHTNFRARLLSMTIVDESGNRMFSGSDVDALGRKSIVALERIFEVSKKLNAITPSDQEELEKN